MLSGTNFEITLNVQFHKQFWMKWDGAGADLNPFWFYIWACAWLYITDIGLLLMRCPFYSLFTIYYFLWPPPDRKRPCVGILTACHFLQKPWLTFILLIYLCCNQKAHSLQLFVYCMCFLINNIKCKHASKQIYHF